MAGDAPEPAHHSENGGHAKGQGFAALTVGAIGVVFGDIGTSPLYAMREALHHARDGGTSELAVLGVVSLMFWALLLIVTLKYVVFLMKADNKGEGGTLALMALAMRSIGRRAGWIFVLGVFGTALFYADGIITPAITVLSIMEGVPEAPGMTEAFKPFVVPLTAILLLALFLVQSRGTASMARFFGPVMLMWFLTLAGLGAVHISEDPSVFRALSPHYAVWFLFNSGFVGFVILGSVFLAVTGAEALYADMGHFGKKPIRAAWLLIAFPALMLNYLGQGAMVLARPETAENPFFQMIPQLAYWPVLLLGIVASVIASQAVITGAFSLTQQAVQLGLLPRIDIKRTSETVAGQIYVPQVNTLLLIGVMILLVMFQSSTKLAAAYGIAVTGAMFVDTLLFFVIIRYHWKRPLWQALTAVICFGALDMVFITSNLLKIPDGAWMPLVLGAALVFLMWTWTKGNRILSEKTRKDSIPLTDLVDILKARAPHRVPGTAIFLTSDVDVTPVALMHNLKHNRVLHEKNIILTVRTGETPRVKEEDRVKIEPMNDDFKKIILTYGFMENPNVPKALAAMRKSQGLKFDIMATSFFLGRRSIVAAASGEMPLWQDKLYIFLMKNAANPTDFFRIPPGRVVELGTQVTV